jgi:hypothetical protein
MLNINIISVNPSDAPISSISRLNMADLEVLVTVITPEPGCDVATQNNRYVSADHTTCEAPRSPAWRLKQYNTYVTARYGILTVKGRYNCTWHSDNKRDKCTSICIYKVYFISL